jgi:hypothetical protein
MSNGSLLPPDIQEEMARGGKAPPPRQDGSRGVGGSAKENTASARHREVAMNPDAVLESAEDAEETAGPDDAPELKACPNPACQASLERVWNYCPTCGEDLLRQGLQKKLGIRFTEEDMSDYLFKGYVVRDVKVLGKHKVTLKTSQPKDLDEIDSYIMSGDWAKEDDGSDRKVSDFYLRQMNALCVTAACVIKLDGQSIGKTLDARMEYLRERGSALIDILSQRAAWFNQALTEYLKKEDTISGS